MNQLFKFFVPLLALCVLVTPRAHSQESIYKRGETYLEQSLLPTPEASSIVKHSDLPVDYATGAFSFSVPLHTLEGRELKIPVFLSYSSSNGIKLDEIAGVAGLGWSLSAGGCITRTVMDMPDEFSSPILRHELPSSELLADLTSGVSDTPTFNYLRDICHHRVDAMLDRYSYNVCGLSGQFLIDDAGNVIQLSGDGVKISYVRNPTSSQIESFIIKGPDGTLYQFREKEMSTHDGSNGGQPDLNTGEQDIWTACTAWYVSSISSRSRYETATFTYQDGYDWKRITSSFSQTRTITRGLDPQDRLNTNIKRVVETHSTKHLSAITLNSETVSFSYERIKDRVTLHQGTEEYNYPAMLRTVVIKNHLSQAIRSFDLQSHIAQNDGRVILSGINRKDSSGKVDDYWTFEYYTENAPVSHFSQDWYGYYNASSSRSGVGICPFTYTPGQNTQVYGGADPSKAVYMSLKKLSHNGECSAIQYEGSKYQSGSTTYNIGLRVKTIAFSDEDIDADIFSTERKRIFTYVDARLSGPAVPTRDMYTSVKSPFSAADMSSGSGSGLSGGSTTWSFTLHETPVGFGPSIRDTRVYYAQVNESFSQGMTLNNPDYCKTVRYYDTSLVGHEEREVFGSFPESVKTNYQNHPPYNQTMDPYVGIRTYYTESGPSRGVVLLKQEEYASDGEGGYDLLSCESYEYSTPVGHSYLLAYSATQVWQPMGYGNINYENIYHYPIYVDSYSGRVPLKKTTIRYHQNRSDSSTVVYTYKGRDNALTKPYRLSSQSLTEGRMTHKFQWKYADELNDTSLVDVHSISNALQTLYYVIQDNRPIIKPDFGGGLFAGSYVTRPPMFEDETVLCKKEEIVFESLLPVSHKEYTKGVLSWEEEVVARDCLWNISEIRQRDKAQSALVWGYGGRYPIALIENSTIAQVREKLADMNLSVDEITQSALPSEAALAGLDSLRSLLPEALVRTFEYIPGVGLSRIRDENGVTLYYEYDASGRVVSVKDAEGNVRESYEYNLLARSEQDNRLSIRKKTYSNEFGDSYMEDVSWWSALGLKLQDISIGASTSGRDLVMAYESDFLMHDDAKVWLPYPVEESLGEYQTDAPSLSASYHEDQKAYYAKSYERSRRDRDLSAALPGFAGEWERSRTETSALAFPNYLWEGEKVVNRGEYLAREVVKESLRDEDGREKHTFRDHLGRTLATSVGSDEPTYYIYDIYGQLRAVKGSGIALSDTLNMWRYDYDSRGRLSARGLPGCAKEFYSYDDKDRLISTTYADHIREYEYDELGRRLKVYEKTAAEQEDRTLVEEYAYRGSLVEWARLGEYDGEGEISGYSLVSYLYDERSRPIRSITSYSDGSSLREDFSYTFFDALSGTEALCQQADSTQMRLTHAYSYDARQRLSEDVACLYKDGVLKEGVKISFAYDALGRPSGKRISNTSVSVRSGILEGSYSYNLQGRLSRSSNVLRPSRVTSIPRSFIEDLEYSPAGMIEKIVESGNVVSDVVKEYGYDYAGRLVEEMVDGESKEFSYDARGNILSDGAKTYLYEGDVLKQCVVEGVADSLSFSHDQMGRMTVDGLVGVEMEYNPLNLISKVSRGDTVCVKYSYLADGRKISSLKEDGSGLEYRGPFVYRRDGSGDLAFESAAFDGGRLTEDKSYCYLTDHLGSTRAVGGISRYSLEEVVDYSAFGEKSQVSSSSLFRDYFTGKEDQMPEFELPYTDFGARMYSSELHRWLSPDPLSEKYYGSSPYNYCSNNPVVFVDPDGRIYETAWDVLSIIVDMGFAIYYQLSGNTEAANDALFDAQCDLIAALIPGYIAGLSKIRYLADVPSINKIKLSYLDDVLGPEDFSKISHMERGRLNEKRVLEAAGLQKNTKKYPGQTRKHGIRDVIPDAVTDNAFFEVKDVKKLNNSPQIEAELDAAIKEGKQFFIITGENTTIAPIIKNNPQINIIQIKGIGPK